MRVFISIVSHGHCSVINDIGVIKDLLSHFNVVIKSNKVGDDFSDYVHAENFHWLDTHYGLGFGANNNLVFNYCARSLFMNDDDYFIVINPDVHINSIDILELIGKMRENNVHVSAINLFRDKEYTVFDNSIRRFPSFITFMKSILGFGNESILNKKEIEKPVDVDWASGSFLAFLSSHYHMLDGFDERYFMYCEDIDICFRSKLLGRQVRYFPCIRAIHYAKHANRDFFSKHFLWHLSGAFRFLFLKKRIEK